MPFAYRKFYFTGSFQFRIVTIKKKKYRPSGNLEFSNLDIFQSLKLRIVMEEIFPISLKPSFTPYTFGGYGLKKKTFE